MGCLKLAYKNSGTLLKVAYRKPFLEEKSVQRFTTVDPISKSYPWYTPYQFAGNMPIWAIDLDGLEPSKNPKSPGTSEKIGMAEISVIEQNAQNENHEINGVTKDQKLLGSSNGKRTNSYITDTRMTSAKKFNLFVNKGNTMKINESNAKAFKNYETFVVSRLLENFKYGLGAENYEFPTNGIISSKFIGSDIFNQALEKYYDGNTVSGEQFSFGFTSLVKDRITTNTFNSITGLTGSGTITIVAKADRLYIKIFNITSVTSGSLTKSMFEEEKYPRSYVRDGVNRVRYGNISQTYNLIIPKNNQ